MSFLQPWLLAALPLIALPIIIHLINQRRFQTIEWAAMMFLLAARRMARGYSRLRQWLIMLARMASVAGLVFAVSRPLSSGWLGLAAGSRPDTTIILLDRSPSMQQRSASGGESKLDTGRAQLARSLTTLGSDRWVLVDSASHAPREIESPTVLASLPEAGPASSAADLPLMLQAAYDYIRDNRTGSTEIWICSDLRENDWVADSGQWGTLRNAFSELPQTVRFHLLAYPDVAPTNVAVRVTDVRRQATSDGAELSISLRLSRAAGEEERTVVPVQFEIEGARSVVNVELVGAQTDLKEHRIPLERGRERGWGRVSIPADANPADDDFYFVFDFPPPRRTFVIADDTAVGRPLALAAGIAPESGLECTVEQIDLEQLATVDWDQLGLLCWQTSLPTGTAAEQVQSFIDRGGQVIFFPPRTPGTDAFLGMQWQTWVVETDHTAVESWRGDEDLLARTLSGAALPVGQLEVSQYCQLSGEATVLASLHGGAPLVARVPTKRGGVYFWATTPAPRDSTLATGGVVLYAFVQRALTAGASVLGHARLLNAGDAAGENPAQWTRIAEGDGGLSTEAAYHRGVYSDGDRLLAVNRPADEDISKVLGDTRVGELFRDLSYDRVDDQAGSLSALVQEIWRMFLIAMVVALVAEAALCLPKPHTEEGAKP